MKNTLKLLLASTALLASGQVAFADGDVKEITVAYFMEWPLPILEAKVDGTFDEALGVKVNWVSFDTGTAMSAAMASGDVQLAVSQGIPPFVVAASNGQALQVLDVAVSYSENDNCVVRTDLEITKDNAAELAGQKVAVPTGTASHYSFLKQMEHFGVDVASLQVVDMAPPDGAAALAQGSVDMACGYGGGLTRMKESGNVLLTGPEKEALGILMFDGISAPSDFVAANPELVSKFLALTEKENARWSSGEGGDEMLAKIASASGMDLEGARAAIGTMAFPAMEEKLSAKWMGGGIQTFMKGVADVFVTAGSIPSALDNYDAQVNITPLMGAKGM
jgi:taurine transport system substrate-binding protein